MPSLDSISGRRHWPRRSGSDKRAVAFSLIELLVVMSLIALLVVLGAPAFSKLLEAGNISSGAQMVTDQMSAARQTAAARNMTVEIRFICQPDRLPAPYNAGSPTVFNALQLWGVDATGKATQALSKAAPLPSQVVIAIGASPYLSPPLASSATPPPIAGTLANAGVNTGQSYVALQVRPSGVIPALLDSNIKDCFVTVLPVRSAGASSSDITGANRTVKNFALVQINPNTGSALIYQP